MNLLSLNCKARHRPRLLQASQLHVRLFARLLINSMQISFTMLSQISKYDDPQEAAIAVVVEAYRLWLQYEIRTDDITIIVARVEGLKEGSALMNKQSMRYNMNKTCANCCSCAGIAAPGDP